MRIDFQHFTPTLPPEDILMSVMLSLSEAYGHAANERLPEFSSHYRNTVLNIEGSDHPSPGKEYTYGTLVTTLTGIGLYMSVYDRYTTSLFRIYDVSDRREPIPIGTGEVKEQIRNNGSAIFPEGLGAAVTETPPVGTS